MDFAVPADHRIKLKESEKKDKCLARELKKTMEHIIPVLIGAFGTVSKGLLKGLEDMEVGGWMETIQTEEEEEEEEGEEEEEEEEEVNK